MKIGIDTLLTIILMVLKVTGVLHISWFLVFLPMIVGLVIVLVLLIAAGLLAVASFKIGGKLK